MALPIGHSLIGIAGARFAGGHAGLNKKRWYLFSVIAANAPDLDLLPGLLIGDVNRFHQGASHSLAAGVLFGLFTGLAAKVFRSRVDAYFIGLLGAAMYVSHLLVDLQVDDQRAPFGIPLFAPISSGHFQGPWLPFRGVTHGVPGDSFMEFATGLFSWNNLGVIGIEVALTAPLLVLVWILSRPVSRVMARYIAKGN